MPAPFTIVTFEDADGDEFPIRVQGHDFGGADIQAAGKILSKTEEDGELSPTWPVTVSSIERLP